MTTPRLPPLLHFTHATWSAPLEEVAIVYVAATAGFDADAWFDEDIAYNGVGQLCADHFADGEAGYRVCKDVFVANLCVHIFHHTQDWDDDEEQVDYPPEVMAWYEKASGLCPADW